MLSITGDTPRSPAATLVQTAARRVLEQAGGAPRRASILDQLIDLGFPFTLYEQGPFVARGIPALTLTTAGERPPEAFADRASQLSTARLDGARPSGAAAPRLARPGPRARAGNDELRLGRRPDRARLGDRARAVRAARPVPRRRRRPLRALPASAHPARARPCAACAAGSPSGSSSALAFYVFRVLGAWPSAGRRGRRARRSRVAGDWPVLALLALGVRRARSAGSVARQRLAPRRRVGAEEQLAGETAALLALRRRRVARPGNEPVRAASSSCPALHAWLWLPQVRSGAAPARALVLAGRARRAAAAPALARVALRARLRRAVVPPRARRLGYVPCRVVAITLGGAACAAQLAAVAAGRYAPYPDAQRAARRAGRSASSSVPSCCRGARGGARPWNGAAQCG